VVLLDPLSAYAKALAAGRARRNADRHLLAVERLDADAGAERGLRDVDRHGRNHVEPLALEEAIGLDLKVDQQVARRTVPRAARALALESNLRPGIDPCRNCNHHFLTGTDLARAVAGRAALARHGAFAETHRTGTLHGEPALAERDRAAPLTLGTGLDLGTGRGSAAVAGAAFFVHLELDRHLAAERRGAERNLKLRLHVLPALGSSRARTALPRAAAEHRAEEIAQPAEPNVAEILKTKVLCVARARAKGRAGARLSARSTLAACAKAAERTELAHLVVLLPFLGVAQHLIGLRDFFEALGGLGVVRIFVRVVLRRHLAVLLLDLVLFCRRRDTEDRVEVLRLSH